MSASPGTETPQSAKRRKTAPHAILRADPRSSPPVPAPPRPSPPSSTRSGSPSSPHCHARCLGGGALGGEAAAMLPLPLPSQSSSLLPPLSGRPPSPPSPPGGAAASGEAGFRPPDPASLVALPPPPQTQVHAQALEEVEASPAGAGGRGTRSPVLVHLRREDGGVGEAGDGAGGGAVAPLVEHAVLVGVVVRLVDGEATAPFAAGAGSAALGPHLLGGEGLVERLPGRVLHLHRGLYLCLRSFRCSLCSGGGGSGGGGGLDQGGGVRREFRKNYGKNQNKKQDPQATTPCPAVQLTVLEYVCVCACPGGCVCYDARRPKFLQYFAAESPNRNRCENAVYLL